MPFWYCGSGWNNRPPGAGCHRRPWPPAADRWPRRGPQCRTFSARSPEVSKGRSSCGSWAGWWRTEWWRWARLDTSWKQGRRRWQRFWARWRRWSSRVSFCPCRHLIWRLWSSRRGCRRRGAWGISASRLSAGWSCRSAESGWEWSRRQWWGCCGWVCRSDGRGF